MCFGVRYALACRDSEYSCDGTNSSHDKLKHIGHYLPLNCGFLFPTYASMPSFASSDWKSCCWSSRSSASADSNGISAPVWTLRLILPTAAEALLGDVNCAAYSNTRSRN